MFKVRAKVFITPAGRSSAALSSFANIQEELRIGIVECSDEEQKNADTLEERRKAFLLFEKLTQEKNEALVDNRGKAVRAIQGIDSLLGTEPLIGEDQPPA